jgi:hypothetical protein
LAAAAYISDDKTGTILAPGQTETSKDYSIVGDVPFQVDRGMCSLFTVTPRPIAGSGRRD